MEMFLTAIVFLRKQNWFQKQFSTSRNRQVNRPKEGAYEAAVAAAAFAIQSVEEAKATKLNSESRKDNGMLHSCSLVGMRVVHRNNKILAVLGSSSAARVLNSNVPDPWDKSFHVEVCQLPNARIGPQQF